MCLQLITFVHTLLAHEDKLNLRRMLVIAPLNTVLNWKDEVIKWTEHLEIDIDVDELQANKKNVDRLHRLQRWYSTGGIMIIGYEMFRNLTQGKHVKKAAHREKFAEYLLKPGPDLVVCDEGHLLKNSKSNIRKSVMRIESKRRVVLTGTPLQNNLKEYHCMVDFVKPNLLGTESEFNNRFIAPITNGQYEDSTPFDVKLMKKRAHVLHEMLAGCVQRKDYSALIKFLPPKYEYILGVKLGELQVKLYQRYLDMLKGDKLGVSGKLFQDFQILGRVWTHPMMLELYRQRKSENSFIDDETSEATPSSSHNEDGSDILVRDSDDSQGSWRPSKKKSGKDGKQNNLKKLKSQDAENKSGTSTPINGEDVTWWKEEVKDIKMNDISLGYKFVLLLEILKKCEEIGDKVLLFSQSILTLDLIEDFLEMIDKAVNSDKDEIMKTLYGSSKWRKGTNYFRIDGTVDAKQRARATAYFNRPQNHGAKLFLISTRAGGMGINLVGANRVIIFDASWNPSFDVQAIFRAYRFGQKKPVYVYRLLAKGTMEEKIYERQIAKLSLSERVVDERQIDRHFTANDLSELYTFRTDDEPSETPAVPKDLLLADLLNSHGSLIKKVMEHDSLLENKVEEELSEAERKAAWEEFQQEKDKVLRTPLPPPPNAAAAASDQPSVPGVYSAAALSRVFLSEREKEGMRAALQHRFPAMQGEDFTRLFEAQCKQVNYQRFQQHLMRVGDGRRVNFQQMQMVQEKVEYERQLQQQQQLQQQRYMQYLQQQQQRQHPN
ncbi:ATRX [Bugula neritina]|uniref:ATRX n=1 Tax=Bugula neritina TaxID=10212 RepID=A0A7J7KGD0_BUGNE|nr:ATRX [Bugula neritina]